MLFRLTAILVLFLVGLVAAKAGLAPPEWQCGERCREIARLAVRDYLGSLAPQLVQPKERFDASPGGSACPVRSGAKPTIFGLLVGPGYPALTALPGAKADTNLMAQVLLERGIDASHVRRLNGDGIDRAAMLSAMNQTIGCLRERDQVLLLFSGHSTIGNWDEGALRSFAEGCPSRTQPAAVEMCEKLAGADEPEASGRLEIAAAFRAAANDLDELILLGSETVVAETTLIAGLGASELSNFVTQVRNRDADAFLVIDTNYAAAADILYLQQLAAAPPGWAAYGSVLVDNGGFPEIQKKQNLEGPVPLFGGGEFVGFYASTPNTAAVEQDQNDQGVFGDFTFAVAEALRAKQRLTVRDLSLSIARTFADGGRQEPVFQASNIDLAFLAPREGVEKPGRGTIDIISPSPKRGASAVEDAVITLVARYAGPGEAFKAIVDGELVSIDANGQFRRDIPDAGTKFDISIRVLSKDFASLAETALRLREKPGEEIAAVAGRRLALIIANESYSDAAFPPLRTPLADARAVAEILTRRFGFATTLGGASDTLDLFMINAGKAQIQQMLFELRRRLTAEDQLVIYYAGHGENDPDLGAYWVPADGVARADFTWIAADEITRELKRMNAQAILVISDSCYAGGLSRSSAGEPITGDARERYLAKAARLKTRQLMASGGEEPVEDGGGGGHSVFAKALIDALAGMDDEVFTASDLFEQKIKPAVISSANALSEGQIPGFHRISRAGDEPGSEFIFRTVVKPPQ